MAMSDQEWSEVFRKLTLPECESRIALLKDRIKSAQHEIACLVIIGAAIGRADEIRNITKRQAQEAIDEAINRINGGAPPLTLKFNTEGGIAQ